MKIKVQFYMLPWAGQQIFAAVEGQGYHHEAIKFGDPVEVDFSYTKVCPCCGNPD